MSIIIKLPIIPPKEFSRTMFLRGFVIIWEMLYLKNSFAILFSFGIEKRTDPKTPKTKNMIMVIAYTISCLLMLTSEQATLPVTREKLAAYIRRRIGLPIKETFNNLKIKR